jgi:hypothetical protein
LTLRRVTAVGNQLQRHLLHVRGFLRTRRMGPYQVSVVVIGDNGIKAN